MSAKYACLVGVLLLSMLPSAGGGQQIPDPVVYRFFFAHLENLDKIAAQQEAAGKDGKGWRSHEQVAMGLTVDEGAAVKQVAADCNRSLKSQESRLKAAMAAVKSQTPKGKSRKEPAPELNRIFAERDQIVSQHIEQLRSLLGEAAFQKLESYLRGNFKPKVKAQASQARSARNGSAAVVAQEKSAANCPPITQVYVFSAATVQSGLVVGECGSQAAEATFENYLGIESYCDLAVPGSVLGAFEAGHWLCDSSSEASCLGPPSSSESGTDTETDCNHSPGTDVPSCSNAIGIPVTPGGSYTASARHDLLPAGDETFGFSDPLGFWDNAVFDFSPDGCIWPPFENVFIDPWFCEPFGNFFCPIELATTEDFVTALAISPLMDSLGPTQTEDFTANVAATWPPPANGTIVSAGTTAHYTAPTHISTETTTQIKACDPANTNNCAVAEVTLKPIEVFVTPPIVDLIPGVAQQFEASINFPDLPSTMKWSAAPAPVAPAAIDANSGLYTPPPPAQVTSPLTVTIKACSTVDDQRCGTATATVKPVTLTVSSPANPFFASAGATLQLSASIVGTNRSELTWTVASTTTPPTPVGTIDPMTGLYHAPLSPVLLLKQDVRITACLKDTSLCSAPYTLTLVPPVVIATVMPTFNAGQSLPFTITGSGFGAHPSVIPSDLSVTFSIGGTPQNPNTSIQGTVSVLPSTPAGIVIVTVTDTDSGLFLAPQASVGVAINPVTITATVTPTTATLQEGQSQQLNAVFACRTAGGVVCPVPQAVLWSLTPNLGTITASGLYTATAPISVQTQVFGKACAAVSPLVCATFLITLTPTVVTVTPASVQLTDGRTQQFTATVTGNSVASVVWLPPAIGTISPTGLYTAPNPVAGPQAITVKACSTVDSSRCGTATVNLIAIRLSPSALTFAPQAVGTISSAQAVTLTNGSPSTLTISGIAPSNGDFALGSGGTCGISLASNASCTVNVVFTPTVAGARTATLTVTDSVASSPQTVALSGTGAQVTLLPSSLFFDPQNINTTSAGKTVTLTNSSPVPLAITSITPPSSAFLESNTCGPSLAANTSCTITVTFSPTTAGSFSGALTVTDAAANSPQTVSLSGSGVLIPTLAGITPSTVTVSSTSFTLVVNGANFVRGFTVVEVNGQPRATTFLSPNQVTTAISSTDLTTVGTLNIAVLNQSPYTGQSGTLPLTVTSMPIPLIGSLSPARVVVGSPDFTLLVNGSNFAGDSVVQINGVSRATTFNSAGQLAVVVSAAEVAHSSFLNATVSTPSTGSSSNPVALAAFRYGDLNFDDIVNIVDLNVMANFLAGNLTLLDSATADLNLDGPVTVVDLNILANYLAGNIHSLPVTP